MKATKKGSYQINLLKIIFIFFLLCSVIFSILFLNHSDALESPSAEGYMKEGLIYYKKGLFKLAIKNFIEAEKIYSKEKNLQEIYNAIIQQSRSYQSNGQYSMSLEILKKALNLAEKLTDEPKIAYVYGSKGNAYIYTNNYEKAAYYLLKGLDLARQKEIPDVSAIILNNMGNLYLYKNLYYKAIEAYNEALILAKKYEIKNLIAPILSNLAAVFEKEGNYKDAEKHLDMALKEYLELEDSHDKSNGLINIAQTYRALNSHNHISISKVKLNAHKALKKAIDVAESLEDNHSASYAHGFLGQMYENEELYEDALTHTRRGLLYAQLADSPESLYLWQWQTGRIFKKMGESKIEEAISGYSAAIETLKSIRHEITQYCNREMKLSFSDSIEPVYFDYADLLFQRADLLQDTNKIAADYLEARETIELLKKEELSNYFKDPCLVEHQINKKLIDTISEDTAVIYIVPFSSRVELLISLSKKMFKYSSRINANTLINLIDSFRKNLEAKSEPSEYLNNSQKLHDLMIRPFEAKLSEKIKILIFIPYGALSKIPMAALHDGKQYLIEKFAIVNTVGLYLTDPKPMKRENMRILFAGVTEDLSGVWNEHIMIKELFKDSTFLLNKDFCIFNIEKELKENYYKIVHIASHAEIRNNVDERYIIAGENSRITVNELDNCVRLNRFRNIPVELLVLAACKTALGDENSALGLAGLTVKAGASSAIATLWESTDTVCFEILSNFYNELKKDPSLLKAEALQRAQLTILYETHPYYWSPFLLIGNWL